MKKFMTILFVPVLAGCLGSGPKPAVNWTIEADSDAKLASVTVCAPYGAQRIAVLRPDGSIAFDAFNAFAAAPGLIIKDALVGRRGEGSLVVRRLALDCRSAGRRNALVELELALGGATGKGSASVPTPDGNYTAAFSRAFAEALARAREGLSSGK